MSYGSSNTPKEDAFYLTPTEKSDKLTGPMKTRYESGVGSINWAANNTRPDISMAANYLASRASNPSQNGFKDLIYCIGYISQSLNIKLEYTGSRIPVLKGRFVIETFSDASFAPGSDAKSISGMAIYLIRNLVKWLSKKQNNISRSTAAELVALSIAEDRTVHLSKFIKGLGLQVHAIRLYEDNQAVIACCQTKSISHTRKLVDIKMKIIREILLQNTYKLEYVSSLPNVADMFTKDLPVAQYRIMFARLFMELDADEYAHVELTKPNDTKKKSNKN